MRADHAQSQYRYMHLHLAGERVDLCYDPVTREVSLQQFPGIIVDRFPLRCGHHVTHAELRYTMECKLGILHADHIQFAPHTQLVWQ